MAEPVRSPLEGKRIVITRAAVQSEALSAELSARGAIPVLLPLVEFADPIDFEPLDAAIRRIEQFDWMIFTSAQAVRSVVARSKHLGRALHQAGSRLRIAAVGPISADAIRQAGLPVEYVANAHNGVGLADELGGRLGERSVLLPRSDRANPELPAALKRHNAQVTGVVAYRTLRPSELDKQNLGRIAAREADAVLFFSPSAVQHFVDLLGAEHLRGLQDSLAITAVGPVTAAALRQCNVQRIVVAADTTAASVLQELEKHFAYTVKQLPAGAKRG